MPHPTPDFLAQLDAIDADVASHLFSLPAERLTRTPSTGHWSALQCVEHLTLMNRVYIDRLTEVVRDAKARGQRPTKPFTYPWTGRVVLWLLEPPPKIKVPIPIETIAPSLAADVDTVRAAYQQQHRDLRHLLEEARDVDLRVTLRHPFVTRVTMQLGTILGAILAHERRHLYQAKKSAGMAVM